jgi:hypothetical protein
MPDTIMVSLISDQQITETLTISNTGAAHLIWNLVEVAGDQVQGAGNCQPSELAWLELIPRLAPRRGHPSA